MFAKTGYAEKKKAIVTLYQELQRDILAMDDFSRRLDACMPLVMRGTSRVCKCMDGRTKGGLHLAGSGLLLWHTFGDEATIDVMGRMRLEGICSHEDCGAAKLVAKKLGRDDPDVLAKWWAQHVAERLDIRYFGHFPVKHDFHPETMIVLDGTGRGQWTSATLPERMVLNAKHPAREYVAEEFGIGLSIIFGPSGMGEVLSSNFPLIVLAVGDPRPDGREAEELFDLASRVVATSGHSNKTVVLPYTPPIEAFA